MLSTAYYFMAPYVVKNLLVWIIECGQKTTILGHLLWSKTYYFRAFLSGQKPTIYGILCGQKHTTWGI